MTDAPTGISIRGPRLLLRPLTGPEIDDEWQEMIDADPMSIAFLPDEAGFKARLGRSGRMQDGWLDLAIDLDGECIGNVAPQGVDVVMGIDELVAANDQAVMERGGCQAELAADLGRQGGKILGQEFLHRTA